MKCFIYLQQQATENIQSSSWKEEELT